MNHCEFVRKSVSFDGLLNGSKSAVSSSFTDKETAREPLQGIEKNPRYHAPLSSAFESSTLIKQNTKPAVPTTQSHTTTRKFLSTMSLKSPLNISAKETKASFPQATRPLRESSTPEIKPLKCFSQTRTESRNVKEAVQGARKRWEKSLDFLGLKRFEYHYLNKLEPKREIWTLERTFFNLLEANKCDMR